MILTDPADPPSALPRGTRLGEFEIKRVLGAGGFGIVYLALDHALEREVAIKEYMPVSMAGRTAAFHVSLLSQSHAESFALGLRSFVNEARLLARFDHPSLVKVHRYWEHNNTAYMAMPFYAGHSLQSTRRHLVGQPSEAYVRAILEPLLGALERLHREGVYHRDISPDNIIVEPDGRPVLLDFGAARRVLADISVALTAILKPAYAPIEQYGETGAVKQGPWTDLYALGATLRYLLLGYAPAPATTRTVVDELVPLAKQPLTACSPAFLQCIDWMLQPRPADRPQSVAALREALDACRAAMPASAQPPARAGDSWQATQVMSPAVGQAHAATMIDPSLAPSTVRIAPAPPIDRTQVLARNGPGAEPTVLLPGAAEITQRSGGPGAAGPASVPAAPQRAPAVAGPGDRTDPTLDLGVAGDAAPQASRPRPLANTPAGAKPRPAGRRWPLAAGGIGAAALLGLALWSTGSRSPVPADAPRARAPAASATPSNLPSLASTAPSAWSAPSAPAAVAGLATAVAPAASAAVAEGVPAAPAALVATAPAPATRRLAASAARATPANVGRPVPQPTPSGRAAAPPPPSSRAVAALPASPGGQPGLATSITRLPAADAPAPAGQANAPATPSAVATGGAPANAAPLPAASPTGSNQASARLAAAPAAAVPAVSSMGTAAALPNPAPPATARAAAPAPTRAAERDNEPVLVQARALSPGERCEGRVLVALWACIERQCKGDASLRDHPECLKLRREP